MNVDIHGAPVYFTIPILGGIPITASMTVTWGAMLVINLLCIWLTHDLKVRNISKRQAVAEKIVMVAENFVRSNMGEQWMQMVPFISAIFALSLGSSLASLQGFCAPTADVSVLLGWALIVFILITYYKIKTNGFFGYLKGFCEPVFVMAPRKPCALRLAPGLPRDAARKYPVSGRRNSGGAVALLRLVLQRDAGIYILHADDDLHQIGYGIRK